MGSLLLPNVMILIKDCSDFKFKFGFNQTQDYIINSLESEFIEKYSSDFLSQFSLVIVVENSNFYHVIKNKYRTRVSGELMENLLNDINLHL